MALSLAYIQYDIVWENKNSNFELLERLISEQFDHEDIIVLPEMFSTGFSMNPEELAEDEGGETIHWMKTIAQKYSTSLCGSIIFRSKGKYLNRFVFVDPSGLSNYYDKRHLYTPGGEAEAYESGNHNIHHELKTWRIMPQICYDLRFPAWSRNTENGYDLLIYVASWPQTRIAHWKRLLAARAIENQCYCLGVNRLGVDGNKLEYNGHSGLYDFNGDLVSTAGEEVAYVSVDIHPKHLDFRTKLNFLSDRDTYEIS